MKILVTGAAGFIGFHLSKRLLAMDYYVIGLDNINDYYDVNLKYARLKELGINRKKAENFNLICDSENFKEMFQFVRMNLEDREGLPALFSKQKIDIVVNLAAQAGVRYSIENPNVYIDSNIVGFLNLLECCRNNKIGHLLYASSSSVYGESQKVPFSISDNVDHPISLYAATKKSNELMAYTYSHLYNIPTTGLRFFTVYGPWGRPDMALFLFTKAIIKGEPIKLFNHGKMSRDFTYIDDIIKGIEVSISNPPQPKSDKVPYHLFNIGNGSPHDLEDFVQAIEENLEIKAKKDYLPLQPGDVSKTWADISNLELLGYERKTNLYDGVRKFVKWYICFYNIDYPSLRTSPKKLL